uniref:Hypothetical conserved protein n=3 Tax=Candidatus Bipolaricaulota TaxID=67810 RepID=H5SFH9_9BACT|nr:hypothetical conserved protein [uncultured Acetothermia bacterium]BAL60051.1 hypothetical conserved protein [Candidatus Acetothermum autotrophicum]
MKTIGIKEPVILIVEGGEDKQFFQALIQHLGLSGIDIMGIGGKDQIKANLKALRNSSGFTIVRSLGIVRDADDDPRAAFQSVCSALQNAGLPVPDRPLVSVGSNPAVTVMILPDINTPGALEDLCLQAVANDPALPCIEQYFECLQKQGFLPKNISKAKVQAFLASRIEAGKRLGEAAQAGYWPWDSSALDQVKNFLQHIITR